MSRWTPARKQIVKFTRQTKFHGKLSRTTQVVHMSEELKMSVSSMTRTKDNKAVYILFTDGEKSAELSLPEGKIISNKGFSDEEIAGLKYYICNNQETIYAMAKKVNPVKAMMNDGRPSAF